MTVRKTVEHKRLIESQNRRADWKKWGPYLSERAWGTVREDYSSDGNAWEYFPHDHARSRAYRWNEDGLGGFCNRFQNICLSVALWNENDPIIKERLFGLSGVEGNHGEDVKEYYYYLDGTPTHSYMKMLYKYPQVTFPYDELVEENRRRDRQKPEYELIDALREEFSENRYFDVYVEYAKVDQEDILCKITLVNRAPEPAPIHILPHLWFRNTWSWGYNPERPIMRAIDTQGDVTAVYSHHRHLAERWWYVDGNIPLLFTENDTNLLRIFGSSNSSPYVKDSINDAVVHRRLDRVNPALKGTKVAAHYKITLPPGETYTVKVRFSNSKNDNPFTGFEAIFQKRIQEAADFYAAMQPPSMSEDEKRIQRQAYAGLMWSKQFYHLSIEKWLGGDPAQPSPPETRRHGRNSNWSHLYNLDILSIPDKWEYPWYAAWDLAFHTVPIAKIDPEWAKRQLILLLLEWYMHPNGQLPAYEWDYGDVNPPVHAWAAWQVYQIDRKINGHGDTIFLEQIFHKLLLNFTWWVNREDLDGHNVFQGGFLGLDNIGVFDRSQSFPTGGHLDQADGTAWMAMYSLNMMAIALELARTRPAYEDVATKFFEHFIYISNAFYNLGGYGMSLWDENDCFFYDTLHTPDGKYVPLKIRSFVGLVPVFAVESLEIDLLDKLPRFKRRMEWFLKYRPQLVQNVALLTEKGVHGHYQLAVVDRDKLEHILRRVFDTEEFLSDYGLRSLSKYHSKNPFECSIDGQVQIIRYEPAESSSGLFGGNSNWRGPIWFPVNYLLVDALNRFHHHYGNTLKVEVPIGSGNFMDLKEAADDLCRRLVSIFSRKVDEGDHRAVFGSEEYFQTDPHWRDYLLFYEYFHGDTGAGIGASHQTGWTALVAKLIQEVNE